ncbi:DNA-binding protein [Streptomyces sp. SM12]|uniref:telomere-protecting terminal protein Tpg n=1 Tax=Streptomyces sp. SM12 TaxID=1071602 RepID=UPI000CD5A897|nr:DNA-binding protein [Streptomyces sp. SM12]
MANEFGDGLDKAVQKAFTRPAPKTAGPQMRYLVKKLGGTRQTAQLLGMSQRQVERYVAGAARKPRIDLATRLENEVKRRWQPQIRAQARKRAAQTTGIIVEVHARLGYTGAPLETTDDARVRHLTVALPPRYAGQLFHAQQQGATEDQLRGLVGEALRDVYFQDNGQRAGSLSEVSLGDVLDLGFEL